MQSRVDIKSERTIAEISVYKLVLCDVRDIASDKIGVMFSLRALDNTLVKNGDIQDEEKAAICGVSALLDALKHDASTVEKHLRRLDARS
ncbi:MAG TPA: hypothetical protein VF747_06380 [Blastocatellia bacterium]|jgi:hypothetical protein